MNRRYSFTLSRNHLILLGTASILLITGTAFGLSVGNTPDTGYLLCTNSKTHAVIYPGKLTCPAGFTNLQLGASGPSGQDGEPGLQGPMGLTGPQGASGNSSEWTYQIVSRDVVGPNSVTTWAGLKRFIVADIAKSNLNGGGNYDIRASLTGQWSTSSPINSYLDCYFQQASQYPSGSQYYGEATASYTSWNGISLNVWGETSDYALGLGDVYLVCNMDGAISGLNGLLTVTSSQIDSGLGLGQPPSN